MYWLRFLAILIAVALTLSVGGMSAAQDPPEPVSPVNVVDRVADTISRINAETAKVEAHRFAPAYFEEPCYPSKADGEKSLAPYRVSRRAFQQEVQTLKGQIIALEGHGANRNIMADRGWRLHDAGRFRGMEAAYARLARAIARKEAELDAIPVQPCRPKTKPAAPVAEGPTATDAGLLSDLPLPPPRFDDPVTAPTLPSRFCSYAERNRFLQDVFWPFHERAKNNAVAAIAHMSDLERRRNEIGYSEGRDTARYKAADRYVKAWEPIRTERVNAAAAALKLHDDINAIPVVDCEQETSTTTGVVGATPPTPPPAPPPAPPATPLPDGLIRPHLPAVLDIALPDKFCSEKAKLDFLVDVYHPRAAVASRNAVLASTYAFTVVDIASEALKAGQRDLYEALLREREAYDPILKAAEASAEKWRAMRDTILAIPVVNCAGQGDPPPLIQPPPPDDGAPPPPKPTLPPPDLKRPALLPVRPLELPKSFCSEFERNAYLEKVYKPTAAAALANAETTKTHLAKLQGMFTQYMRQEGGPGWAAVRQELALYEPIAKAAYEESLQISQRYNAILAIPVVPCTDPAPTWDGVVAPPPVEPVDETPDLSDLIIGGTRLPGTPGRICDEAQRAAQQAAIDRAREQVDEDARRLRERQSLLEAGKASGEIDVTPEMLADLVVKGERIRANEEAVNTAQSQLDAVKTQNCPPPEDAKPPQPPVSDPPPQTGARPADAPVFKDFDIGPDRSRFCTRAEAEAYLRDTDAQLEAVLEERDRFDLYIGQVITARVLESGGSLRPDTPIDANAFSGLGSNEAGLPPGVRAAIGRAYVALGPDGVQRLRYYDGLISMLRARRASVARLLDSGNFQPFDCPDPAPDGGQPATPGQPATTAPPPTGVLPDPPKKPCPPKKGRKPIKVGANGKVGSGAQLKGKLGGMALGAIGGALGLGGGGGGGGSDGPALYKCRIKDSEMTLFTDPVSGVAIKVGAKRQKNGVVVIFTDIAKSPDKGTFQTAFLERPTTGETQAPFDVGPCDLWGEWKLTVSWTRTTYVNGQMVSQESGGWSEGGFFSIPGTLSREDAPDGMWRRMGFSSASHGARKAAMQFRLAEGGGPMTFVIHITQPKGDPVTTVPFVMTMVETAPGVFAFTEAKDEDDCPPEVVATGGPTVASTPPATPPVGPPLTTPAAPPPSKPTPPPAAVGPGAPPGDRSVVGTAPSKPKGPELKTYQPPGADRTFVDHSEFVRDVLNRSTCSREDALANLALIDALQPKVDDAVTDFEVFVGARIAAGTFRPDLTARFGGADYWRTESFIDDDGTGLAFDEQTIRALTAAQARAAATTDVAGGWFMRDLIVADMQLKNARKALVEALEKNQFPDCPNKDSAAAP